MTGEIIDLHAHFGTWNFPIPGCGTVDNLLRLCERYNIRWAACSSAEAIVYDMQSGNAALAEAIANAEPLLGYVVCNPNDIEGSVREMEAYLSAEKFVGVKIHPSYARMPTSAAEMAELFDEIARRARLVLIHTYSGGDAQAVAKYARKHPHLAIILAHAGGPDTWAAVDAVADVPNVYLDFCCSHALRGRIEYALQKCGPGRLVFGSDMDLLDPAFTLGMFQDAGLNERQLRMALWENAVRLLGIGG